MFSSLVAAGFLGLAGFVNAQGATVPPLDPAGQGLNITAPTSDIWWVQGQQNVLIWTCKTANPTLSAFTVVITNQNPDILNGPEPFKANLVAADCDETIDATQFTPATGYQIWLSNPVNLTDVYSVSQLFEIKAAGSPFASITSTDIGASQTSSPSQTGSGASGSGSGSGSAATSSPTGAASRTEVALGFTGFLAGLVALLA